MWGKWCGWLWTVNSRGGSPSGGILKPERLQRMGWTSSLASKTGLDEGLQGQEQPVVAAGKSDKAEAPIKVHGALGLGIDHHGIDRHAGASQQHAVDRVQKQESSQPAALPGLSDGQEAEQGGGNRIMGKAAGLVGRQIARWKLAAFRLL